jgi:hypothetical protein
VIYFATISAPPTSLTFEFNSKIVHPSSTVKIISDSAKPISCLSSSYPSPEYKWTFNGHTTEVSQEATLFPSQVTRDGRYYCYAKNTMIPSLGSEESGSAYAFIDIQRLCKFRFISTK